MKKLCNVLLGVILIVLINSCTKVSPNMHLVYTNDCWNHIKVVKAGDIKLEKKNNQLSTTIEIYNGTFLFNRL